MNADIKICSIHIMQPEETSRGIPPKEQIASPDGKTKSWTPIAIINNGKGNAYLQPSVFIPRRNGIHIRPNNPLPVAMTKSFDDRDIDKEVVIAVPVGLAADAYRQPHFER